MFDNTGNENLSNKGIQVDLGEYLEYKKQFKDTRTISYSSSDLYHKRKNEQEEARSDFFIYGGAAAASTKVLYEKAKKDEGIRALIEEVPGAKLLKQKLSKQFLDNQAAQIISGAIDPRSTAVAPLSQSLQSILVSLEELSPSQILKTLQLSSFNSLFVEVIDEERKKARHIKQTSIQVYENYYKNLIFKESKIKLMDEDIKHGFILQNNKLYQAVPESGNKGGVKAGRVLLDYATVVNSTIKTGDNHHSVNRVFEKFSNIYDANLNRNQLHTEPFVVVGGASKKATVSTWARAYGRFSLEIGAKSLDNPLGFLEEYLDMTGLNNSKLVKNKYFQTAKGFTNFKLGTGGVYNISSTEMMKKIGKNLAIKGAAGVVGLNIIDATLDALTPDSSVWSNGLVAGMADTFMKAHVKFAELWSDNFQDLKKSQENSAPESTKLSTLIGVPLAGAMTGANIAFFKRMKDTTTKGLEQSSTIHTAEQKLGGLLGKAADKVGINIVGNTLSRYSKVGALLGATLTLPFLPGALVGKSSEELRQEYSGEKEVAVRKDRGWLCMTPDTPIFSSVGYSRAEDIKTGDFLYNRYGTKNKVISVHKRYTKELAYEFKTAYSTNLWTTVTADHKVLTSNGWVPANKINVGDYVVTGIPKLNINSKLLDLASYVNTEKHITETAFFSKQKTRNPAVTVTGKNILCNRYIKIDYQFGLFLGWFLAEGCVSRDKNGKFRPIEISFHKTEENFAIEILEYLNKLTGNTKEIKIYPNQGEGRRIRYSNSILSEFLISFMYRDGVKIFPDLTLFNKECIKGFLIGMFYGDGSITKHKNVRNKFKLKSQYIQHLFEYRRYLSVFGIYGSIYQDRGTGCFILELSGQCSDKANELGLYKELYSYQSISKNFNCRSYYIEDEKVYVKVEKISVYEYEGYVYDYTMENIHEYTPNSFVIHNSGGTEYEGGQIKYFRQNLLKTIASDAKTKTLYGDRETKRRLDPVFNPIKYLRNPYRFEEMHQEDMPFPVWGMDVSYGSVLGQLYKGTIGELIKPTVIHPEFLKLQSEANPNLVLGVKGEIAKGISETISGKNSKNLSQLSAGNGEENSDTSIAIVDSDAYSTPENERKEVKSLIADGLMLRANAPTVSVLDRTLAGTSASLSDFTGLKGFSSSLLLGAANLDPTEQLRPELEVSGTSTSFSGTLSDANLGDMLGCFVPNTKVLTSTGYKEIQNITKGDLVLSKNGVFQKVNEVFEKSFKDIQILKVSLGLGYEDIYCTPDHIFPVIKRVRYSYGHLKPLTDFTVQDLEIGSLETGSLLMLPKNKETKVFDIDLGLTYSGVKTNCYLYPKSKYEKFGELYETLEVDPGLGIKDLKLLGFNQNQSKDMKGRLSGKKAQVQRISRKIVPNKNVGKLIGWWLAEGSVDCGRISISLHKDELHFAKELMEIIKEILNVQCSLNYSKTSNGMVLRFNHKPFSEYLLNTFGNKSYNKHIPEEYILNTEVRRGIIFGICHGDGWYNKDIKKGGYTSTSYELCKAVSRMLRYEGVLHNMLCNYDDSENHILPGKREVKSQFHKRNNIVINQLEAFNLYLELLEVDPCSIAKIRPNFSNFEDDNHTYISIKRIEVLDYSGLMYDLSIENTPYYTVNDVLCHNSGEFSRRLIPQSAAVKRDTINPMRNQVAPDWLPKNETKYYKNFERGNYYSHMENGEYLLPGSKGFETLNPELKGVDPNNYPLVHQYKILQNVARGSSEHIAVKKYLAEHLDELSEKEKDVFFEAYGQDTERDVQKRFTDYKTGSEKSNMGVVGLTQNAIWESFSHLESPLEPLTPFRPMAKFVHQRTAVEDYIKTQLMGSDVGIWTNPYSHFLKPTLNRLADSGSIDQFKPKEAIEKENIDTYFDKLSLVKAIKTNDTYDIERNITALSYLGINDPGSMKRFKSALPEGQSAYVEAFSQEKDKKKRNQILSLVPKDIGRAYQSIWSNIDIYDQAILRGNDPNKALEEEYLKDSKKLKSALSIDITRQDKETIHNQASTLANDEDKKRFEQYQEAKLVRLKAAQKEASEYVENQTGSLPSDNWIGWDPRLTIDDIKLKTLTIGKEDIHRFGYWQKDLERSERLIGLKEGGIVNELENIKAEKRSNVAKEFAIRSRLRNIGFEVSTINSVPSNSNQLKITDKQEYLRAYNNSV